jgi:hypothetical protein
MAIVGDSGDQSSLIHGSRDPGRAGVISIEELRCSGGLPGRWEVTTIDFVPGNLWVPETRARRSRCSSVGERRVSG